MKKVFFLFLLCCAGTMTQAQTARTILDEMLVAIDHANTLTYTMNAQERYGSKMIKSEMDFKVQVSPARVYMKQLAPKENEGIEVLWSEGMNNNKALVNPNGFPYVNVSFSPYNSMMRKTSHHTITTAGFEHPAKILRNGLKAAGDNFNQHFVLDGEVTWKGKSCYKILCLQPDFKYVSYTLTKDEYLYDIAYKQMVSEQMIAEANKLSLSAKVRAGKTIRVPNFYAKKIIFYIDKETMFPIYQEIHDDKGLYETYEFNKLVVNPRFSGDEFTEDCKSYDF